jgi:DNA-binding transcriptional LysR family regulator
MTLLGCQIFSTIAREGSFARTAEQLHLTPSAISHAVASMETECGFPLFTRTKNGVTMTAAAEGLLPNIRRVLASRESLDQSIAQINGMQKGVLRLAVFNSACVTWLPQLLPEFEKQYPGIAVRVYQGSYADVAAWLKSGSAEIGFLSNSCAQELAFEPLYDDPLVCIAPQGFVTEHPGKVYAGELREQAFVSQRSDTDADIQNFLKENDLRVRTRCYVIDDESTIAMVACGQGVAILPELILKKQENAALGISVLKLLPNAKRTIGLACLDRTGLSPAARMFWQQVQQFVQENKAGFPAGA